jgi:hypothetical protein
MLHTALLSIVLAQNTACSGTDLSINSARVMNVSRNNGLNHYTIAVTVKNMGAGQPANALQFVDIYKNGEKKDARGVPPLGSNQSYTFNYGYDRSAMAGDGTIALDFQVDPRSGRDCSQNSSFRLTF